MGYYAKGKWFVKAINETTVIESMTLHPYVRDGDGKMPKRYSSPGNRQLDSFTPMDAKRKLTCEMCVFRLGDSDRRYWLLGPLVLGDGEVEEAAKAAPHDAKADRKKETQAKETTRRRRSRTRSRSRRRKKTR